MSLGYDRDRAKRLAEKRWPARFTGNCVLCPAWISVGDLVRWEGVHVVHAECPKGTVK